MSESEKARVTKLVYTVELYDEEIELFEYLMAYCEDRNPDVFVEYVGRYDKAVAARDLAAKLYEGL